jgi:hypothetical protein
MMVVGMLLSLGALSMTALASTAAHAEITRSGDTVYVQGQIEKDDHLRFTDLFDDGVTTVVLNSSGGYVHVAIAIGTLVHERQLTTVVAPGGMCGSACVAAWAGGTRDGSPPVRALRYTARGPRGHRNAARPATIKWRATCRTWACRRVWFRCRRLPE